MNRTALALALALASTACGGKLPETRYYQLATQAPAAAHSTPAAVTLAIQPLEVDPAYDDERIVYRLTPYRLDYYNYHRWSAPPGTLVSTYLERAFERSGAFKGVTRESSAAPVTLGGRVIALEEVDKSKTSWFGRIVIELTLTDSSNGDVLWSAQFEESEPLKTQSPEGLAIALSAALERVAKRALPDITAIAAATPTSEATQRAARSGSPRRR